MCAWPPWTARRTACRSPSPCASLIRQASGSDMLPADCAHSIAESTNCAKLALVLGMKWDVLQQRRAALTSESNLVIRMAHTVV